MKKTWYRLTLDVAYEGDILGVDSKPVTDAVQTKEVLMRVVKHDIDVALRLTPSGPVDWDLVSVEPGAEPSYEPAPAGEMHVLVTASDPSFKTASDLKRALEGRLDGWDVDTYRVASHSQAPIDSGRIGRDLGHYPCSKCHGQHFTGECPNG